MNSYEKLLSVIIYIQQSLNAGHAKSDAAMAGRAKTDDRKYDKTATESERHAQNKMSNPRQ